MALVWIIHIRYISKPLLLEKRKFDIRAYLLIVSAQPYVVLCHHGYVRLSCLPYDCGSDELGVHLTNQYVQKRQAHFKETETIWSMEQLQHYIDQNLPHLPDNWVQSHLLVCCYSYQCYRHLSHNITAFNVEYHVNLFPYGQR